jgi:arylsulfatase A-like enzyme
MNPNKDERGRTYQPNILLVFVDNQPANMMGCYGNDEIFTPNLDALTSRGILF